MVKSSNFDVFCHNVRINCSELVSVRMETKISMRASIEVLHLILCEEMTQLQRKICIFFQFGGHNVIRSIFQLTMCYENYAFIHRATYGLNNLGLQNSAARSTTNYQLLLQL